MLGDYVDSSRRAALPVRPRPVVHHVGILRLGGRRRDDHDAVRRRGARHQHRRPRRDRSRAVLRPRRSRRSRGRANSSPGFARVDVEPGATTIVEFEIDPTQLAYYDEDMHLVIEPGDVRVMIGPLSTIVTMDGPRTRDRAERPRPHPNRRQIRSLSERYRRQFAARTIQAWRSSSTGGRARRTGSNRIPNRARSATPCSPPTTTSSSRRTCSRAGCPRSCRPTRHASSRPKRGTRSGRSTGRSTSRSGSTRSSGASARTGRWNRRASRRCAPVATTSTRASATWTSTACGRRSTSRRRSPASAARCSRAARIPTSGSR